MDEEYEDKEEPEDEPDEEEEDGFTKGYLEDEEVEECAECGSAIKDEKKKVAREIDGEEYVFCSEACAKEFEESVKTE